METGIYVDVLLTLNYVVNLLLISCAAKLAGRKPARRRMVAAALFGAAGSLAIFLPFMSFWVSAISRLVISAGIVLISFRWMTVKAFFSELFIFYSVSFFFAGVMLGLWLLLKPGGMVFYNGIVYFSVSPISLMLTTVAAYIALEVFHRLSRRGRLAVRVYMAEIHFMGLSITLSGLVDSGNSLCEPFSGIPVMLCGVDDIAPLLPETAVNAIKKGGFSAGLESGVAFRAIPYSNIGGEGMLPAFKPDCIILSLNGEKKRVESVYIGLSREPVGDDSYSAVLNPDIAGFNLATRQLI